MYSTLMYARPGGFSPPGLGGSSTPLRTRIVKAGPQIFLDLDPIDSDEGKLLIASYPMSISPAKK